MGVEPPWLSWDGYQDSPLSPPAWQPAPSCSQPGPPWVSLSLPLDWKKPLIPSGFGSFSSSSICFLIFLALIPCPHAQVCGSSQPPSASLPAPLQPSSSPRTREAWWPVAWEGSATLGCQSLSGGDGMAGEGLLVSPACPSEPYRSSCARSP